MTQHSLHHLTHHTLLAALSLLLSVIGCCRALAQDSMAVRPHDFIMPGYYTTPDFDSFSLHSWRDGWSVGVDWQPHVDYSRANLHDIVWGGLGVNLTKDFNKTSALRLGYNMFSGHHELSLDYQWNLSNYYNGYYASCQWEWLLTMGGKFGYSNTSDRTPLTHKPFAGGQVGLQLRHTLTPYVSLYIEPQYHLASPWFDTRMAEHNMVDDAVSLRIGLITRLAPPFREDNYGHDAYLATLWMRDLGLRFIRPKSLTYMHSQGTTGCYTELLGGVRLATPHRAFVQPVSLELNIGHQLSTIYGVQLGIYQQQLGFDLANATRHSREESFGARLELSASVLRAIWPSSYDLGWAWTLSGGGEAGRLQTWDHASHPYYHNLGATAATQLRRRLQGPLWLVLQGRMQWIDMDSDHQQASVLLGLHYDVPTGPAHIRTTQRPARRRRQHTPMQWQKLSFQIQSGWWNAHDLFLSASAGFDFTPVHGLRGDLSFSRTQVSTSSQIDWQALSLDYVANLSNAAWGYNPDRRLDIHFLAGYNLALHRTGPSTSLFSLGSYVGMEAGLQTELRLSRHLSFFAEEKALFLPFDLHLTPNSQQTWHMQGGLGIKVRL